MVFGFNTDVVCGPTCYHLQSEFLARDRLLQTQVFVTGRCIGKIANQAAAEADDERTHEKLREQHRAAVAAARQGAIEQWLAAAEARLELELQGAPLPWRDGALVLTLKVTRQGHAVVGAAISISAVNAQTEGHGSTDEAGVAQVELPIAESELWGCVLDVHVEWGTARATRRFRLHRAE
ncbi:MAG: hypothetical protein JO041_14215 [Acidobacteria bacterium]|nr:hypothetical protein [Acidobacteriota bacterium]